MLEDLQDMGYQISISAVTRVRKQMGLVRRMSVFNRQALDSQLFEILRRELDDGRVLGYGRGLLWTYFRRQGQLVTRYPLFYLYPQKSFP